MAQLGASASKSAINYQLWSHQGRTEGVSAARLPHTVGGRIACLEGYWPELWFLGGCWLGGLPQLLATWASPFGSSQHGSRLPSEQARACRVEWNSQSSLPNLRVTAHHLCWVLFIRSESVSAAPTQGGQAYPGLECQELEVTGAVSRLPTPVAIYQHIFFLCKLFYLRWSSECSEVFVKAFSHLMFFQLPPHVSTLLTSKLNKNPPH